MQILIDATPLLLRSAGVKNYTYYWIQSLWEQARNDRILTLPALARLGPLNHEDSIAGRARRGADGRAWGHNAQQHSLVTSSTNRHVGDNSREVGQRPLTARQLDEKRPNRPTGFLWAYLNPGGDRTQEKLLVGGIA